MPAPNFAVNNSLIKVRNSSAYGQTCQDFDALAGLIPDLALTCKRSVLQSARPLWITNLNHRIV